MRATITSFHSPHVYDLESWVPPRQDFAFLLELMIGPTGGMGEESFGVTVCTLEYLRPFLDKTPVIDGRHICIVKSYDWPTLKQYFEDRVADVSGETWVEVADKLSRIGEWEFEDYRPAP